MGELAYSCVAAGSEGTQAAQKLLADAVRRFSRSIELCDDYLRGYYGLKKVFQKTSNPEKLGLIAVSRQLTDYWKVKNRWYHLQDQISLHLVSLTSFMILRAIN